MSTKTMKVGPFTWRREDNGGCECWDLVVPKDAELTFFCVKNYGGKPNNSTGFSGWRLVSGGPFTAAGGWTSREDAMRGVVSYLRDYYRKNTKEKLTEAKRRIAATNKWIKKIEGVT